MAGPTLMVADDLSDRSSKGLIRSRIVQENAIRLAQALHLTLDLVFVADFKPLFLKDKKMRFVLGEFDTIRKATLQKFKKNKVSAQLDFRYGIPAEEILSTIKESPDCRLLVLGTQGKKGLKKLLLGSVAEEVIRNAPIPVFVIGPVVQEKRRVLTLNRELNILFLTDFSDASVNAERFLMKLAKEIPCSVQLVHSIGEQILKIKESLYQAGTIPLDMEKMFGQMGEDAYRELERMNKIWEKAGIKSNFKLITAEAHLETSLRGLLEKADLVVMGTHGRNKVLSAFIGSVARRIILKSPAPVIVVRSNNVKSPGEKK